LIPEWDLNVCVWHYKEKHQLWHRCFTPLIEKVEQITGLKYTMMSFWTLVKNLKQTKLIFIRVVVDHVRAVALYCDGQLPSNTGAVM
jgi:alanyl-tRNA synthetase